MEQTTALSEELKKVILGHETPLYVYDTKEIRKNFINLRQALPTNFNILYSLKANPHPRVISELKELGSCFDVASYSELKTVLDAGVSPTKISFVGPGKTEREIRFALESKVEIIVTESLDQLKLVNQVAGEFGINQKITARVNPKEYVDLKGRVRMNRSIQFGIDEEDLGAFFELVAQCKNVKMCGIHTHVQSQILEPGSIAQNFEMTWKLFNFIKEKYNSSMNIINFGGGFGIPYLPTENKLDMNGLKEKLAPFAGIGAELTPFAETGRYIVGPTGFFVTKVLYRKESRGKKLLVMDGGMNNNFSVVGAAQFERRNYIVTPLLNEKNRKANYAAETANYDSSKKYEYTLVGPSCYFMDTLGNDLELPEMFPGDYVCFHNSGCYGRSFSPTLFLGQQVAQEIFV